MEFGRRESKADLDRELGYDLPSIGCMDEDVVRDEAEVGSPSSAEPEGDGG